MSRYTGPNNKQSRRLGFSLLESGKDLKRPFGPGQHGKDRKKKPSNYSIQLAEKQKLRFMYGLNEKQFKRIVEDAGKMKGVHGENIFILLESRLDNLVYRAGFAMTRRGARQLVNHGPASARFPRARHRGTCCGRCPGASRRHASAVP